MKQSEFYSREAVSPFRRDLSDSPRYFEQRRALLEHLGIPARLLRSARILEFGPGHGENALFLLEQAPAELILVEINEECVEAARALLEPKCPASTQLECLHMDMQAYVGRGRFDLVIFEGVIPFEPEPEQLLRRTAGYVGLGGILSVTTIDSVSLFSEALRRLVGLLAAPTNLPSQERVARLLPLFSPHLDTLDGMTRGHGDWVLDQMIHPWSGRQLSILDAANALGPQFELYGSSPRFLTDWRWFRDIHGAGVDARMAERCYLANLHNLIDYRMQAPARDPADNRYLLELCDGILDGVRAFEITPSEQCMERIVADVISVAAQMRGEAPDLCLALEDYLGVLASWRAGEGSRDFGRFGALFGRGQQYVSFLRRAADGEAEA